MEQKTTVKHDNVKSNQHRREAKKKHGDPNRAARKAKLNLLRWPLFNGLLSDGNQEPGKLESR